MKWIIAALLSFAALAPAAATDVSVSIDPAEPVANESFRVVFQADGPVDAEPDFSELEALVDILGRNRQTSIQWINGRNSRTTTWVLDVLVRAPGPLTIPVIAFGSDRSAAKSIDVLESRSGASTTDDPGLLLEIEVDTSSPYVQQEVVLTARLLRRVELSDANMTDPSTDADAIIKRLGSDSTYQTMRNQKRYEAFERRYSIFPQTSGTVTIEPMVLTTQLVPATRSLFDPFRRPVQTRRIESNSVTLDVKPIPATYTGDTWLPARRLRLRDDWEPAGDTLEAGEPLTRTVFLWADGLNAGQLPEVPITLPDGLKSYPDQPQTSEQQADDGFTAVRQQKYAIIPHAGGDLVFPEIAVTWWNTVEDQMEIARIGEQRFRVNAPPAPAATAPPPPVPTTPPGTGAQTTVTPAPAATVVAPSRTAELIALMCLLGWLATAAAWWLRSRGAPSATTTAITGSVVPESVAKARRDVLGACKANDARGAKRALLQWARVAFQDPPPRTLGALAAASAAPLDHEIRALDTTLYGPGGATWDAFALQEAFEHSGNLHSDATGGANGKQPLPELYPLSDS
ncbi:MAG: BatD family protein [Gammaproteobacteria bacterium]